MKDKEYKTFTNEPNKSREIYNHLMNFAYMKMEQQNELFQPNNLENCTKAFDQLNKLNVKRKQYGTKIQELIIGSILMRYLEEIHPEQDYFLASSQGEPVDLHIMETQNSKESLIVPAGKRLNRKVITYQIQIKQLMNYEIINKSYRDNGIFDLPNINAHESFKEILKYFEKIIGNPEYKETLLLFFFRFTAGGLSFKDFSESIQQYNINKDRTIVIITPILGTEINKIGRTFYIYLVHRSVENRRIITM